MQQRNARRYGVRRRFRVVTRAIPTPLAPRVWYAIGRMKTRRRSTLSLSPEIVARAHALSTVSGAPMSRIVDAGLAREIADRVARLSDEDQSRYYAAIAPAAPDAGLRITVNVTDGHAKPDVVASEIGKAALAARPRVSATNA